MRDAGTNARVEDTGICWVGPGCRTGGQRLWLELNVGGRNPTWSLSLGSDVIAV